MGAGYQQNVTIELVRSPVTPIFAHDFNGLQLKDHRPPANILILLDLLSGDFLMLRPALEQIYNFIFLHKLFYE